MICDGVRSKIAVVLALSFAGCSTGDVLSRNDAASGTVADGSFDGEDGYDDDADVGFDDLGDVGFDDVGFFDGDPGLLVPADDASDESSIDDAPEDIASAPVDVPVGVPVDVPVTPPPMDAGTVVPPPMGMDAGSTHPPPPGGIGRRPAACSAHRATVSDCRQ